jgi:hypothetical protein
MEVTTRVGYSSLLIFAASVSLSASTYELENRRTEFPLNLSLASFNKTLQAFQCAFKVGKQ